MTALAASVRARAERLPVPWPVLGAMVLGLAIRLAYVVATKGHVLAGDEPEYDIEGRLAALGHWFWSTHGTGVPHPSMWKSPGYGAFLGVVYTILGPHYDRALAVQALFGPVTILLTWLLGRRLFSERIGVVAALVVAVYPMAWQFDVRLYSESLATPLTVLVLWLVLDREPSVRRAAGVGALMALLLLVRSSSVLLFAGIALAWLLACGWRRGAGMTALTVVAAALLIAPWTIRNHVEFGGFTPISVQSSAAYGTFNAEAAHDPVYPYAWRPLPAGERHVLLTTPPLSERELGRRMKTLAFDYISAHPASLAEAFFWNGLSRLWDVRRPARALHEVALQGRTRSVAALGLAMYYVLFPLMLLGLWSIRRRPRLLVPVLGTALAASVVFTSDSGTRYRAPLEPLIVVLACAGAAWLAGLARTRRARRP